MRIFSHTCSNTEIVCALGCGGMLVGVDADSDYPPEILANLPKPGRDLDLDVAAVTELKPDLVLTSLTVPGHEKVAAELEQSGIRTLCCDPRSLQDVYADIRSIATTLGVPERGDQLVMEMDNAMPIVNGGAVRPKLLVEWWPKPVITPTRQSWVTDMIKRAGGCNPWSEVDAKSAPLETAAVLDAQPDAVIMSWCGVAEDKYRADVVRRREGWAALPAIQNDRIIAIGEAFLGRPGPRLVEGYRRLRQVVEGLTADRQ